MPQSDLRMGILELMRMTRTDEQDFVGGLSQEERMASGTPEQWCAKDLIAHVSAWRLRTVERLRAALEGTDPPPLGSDDEENAAIFAKYGAWSWQHVEAEADRSVAELADLLPGISDTDLTDGQRFAWNGGRPLLNSVLGNGVEHPATHLEGYYREHGQPARGIQLRERLVAAARGARLPDQVLATGIYNLACAYALSANGERALAVLPEAVRLQPDLARLARDDPDFASIRDLPAFHALVGG